MTGKIVSKISVFFYTLLILIFTWLIVSSIEIVPPGRVHIVRVLGLHGNNVAFKSIPLLNGNDRRKIFFKQPKIPFLKIGFIEASLSIEEVREIAASFAFYTTDKVTGVSDDREWVQAFTLEGRIEEITDWNKFVSNIDIQQINFETGEGPYTRKYNNRIDIIAEELKIIASSGSTRSPYGTQLKDEYGSPLMNIETRVNYWINELLTRRNFIVSLIDSTGLETEEEIMSFLMTEVPWYYIFGINSYESLINSGRELQEYLQSVFSHELSPWGSANRYLDSEDYLLLLNQINRTYSYELSSSQLQNQLDTILTGKRSVFRDLDREEKKLLQALVGSYNNSLRKRGISILDVSYEAIESDLVNYINSSIIPPLVNSLRYTKLQIDIEEVKNFSSNYYRDVSISPSEAEVTDSVIDTVMYTYRDDFDTIEWENFQTIFSKVYNDYISVHPEYQGLEKHLINYAYLSVYQIMLDNISRELEESREMISRDEALVILEKMFLEYDWALQLKYGDLTSNIVNQMSVEGAKILESLHHLIRFYWQEEKNRLTGAGWEELRKEELIPYYEHYKESLNVEESDTLWRAAINNALSGEDLSLYRPYNIYWVERGESLKDISANIGIPGSELLRINQVNIEFAREEDQFRLAAFQERLESGECYEEVKNFRLKEGSQIIVYKVSKYSSQWWEARELNQEKRKLFINQFIFPWIETHAPDAFDIYIRETPYLGYLEKRYGIKLTDIRMYIEKRNIYSNPRTGQMDYNYYNLWESND